MKEQAIRRNTGGATPVDCREHLPPLLAGERAEALGKPWGDARGEARGEAREEARGAERGEERGEARGGKREDLQEEREKRDTLKTAMLAGDHEREKEHLHLGNDTCHDVLVPTEQQQDAKRGAKLDWDALPFDLLLSVFSALDGRSVASASMVCRAWSRIGRRDELWERLVGQLELPPFPPSVIRFSENVLAALGNACYSTPPPPTPLGQPVSTYQPAAGDRSTATPPTSAITIFSSSSSSSSSSASSFPSLSLSTSPPTSFPPLSPLSQPRDLQQLRARCPPSGTISWRDVFLARSRSTRSMVIDLGCGYCKFGWSNQPSPADILFTYVEFGDVELSTPPMIKRLCHSVFANMQVGSERPHVAVIEPHCGSAEDPAAARRNLRGIICNVLFRKYKVPSVSLVDQAVSATFVSNRVSAIVVNIGFRSCTIMPVYRGRALHDKGLLMVGLGSLRVTTELNGLLNHDGLRLPSIFTVKAIKEQVCYVAENVEEEVAKNLPKVEVDMDAQGGKCLIGNQRFLATEILFEGGAPGGWGASPSTGRGMHQLMAKCMQECALLPVHSQEDQGWFKTIIFSGGSGVFKGLTERLRRELTKLLPKELLDGLVILPPALGPWSTWQGGKLVANLSNFPDGWAITKEAFNNDPGVIHRPCGVLTAKHCRLKDCCSLIGSGPSEDQDPCFIFCQQHSVQNRGRCWVLMRKCSNCNFMCSCNVREI
ncbi:hypothetical protein CBR_g3117 [Chara braunii]|uniref:F-box domain-containing protein n=1 Tax=Chara braunii TaxID=69332 RepID=A0A388KET0_CHABU|nr:hypothetical protein CBR_g3117 [Chara braunii]|eukprot:GBG68572.1 hypothetical protein CBR_g3117 [Chara braunii]